jgi:hypothetical protein
MSLCIHTFKNVRIMLDNTGIPNLLTCLFFIFHLEHCTQCKHRILQSNQINVHLLRYFFLIILTKCPSMNIKPYAVEVLLAHIWNIALYYRIECLTTSIAFIFLTSNLTWCGISEERNALNPWYKCNLECSKMCYMTIVINLLSRSRNREITTAEFCWCDLNINLPLIKCELSSHSSCVCVS